MVPGLTVISPGCAVPGGLPDELLELLELDEEVEPDEDVDELVEPDEDVDELVEPEDDVVSPPLPACPAPLEQPETSASARGPQEQSNKGWWRRTPRERARVVPAP